MDRITGRAEKRRRTGRKRFLITMLSLSLAAGLSEVTALTAAAAARTDLEIRTARRSIWDRRGMKN